MMQRFSLRTLMLFILVVAIELTALRNANIVWARVMAMFTIGLIGLAVLQAAFRRGRRRAWWTGFALAAGAYVVVSLGPAWPRPFTTRLLEWIHAKAVESTVVSFEMSRWDKDTLLFKAVSPDGVVHTSKVPESVANSISSDDLMASIGPLNPWRSAFPGATDRTAFHRVGQAIFSLLAGLIGGTFALCVTTFQRRQKVDDRHVSARKKGSHAAHSAQRSGQ
jgi:hypothetical protein